MMVCDSKTKLYKSWQNMKRRCLNPDIHHKKYYDGITICDEWLNFKNFKKWALENGYQKGLTIDRINPDDDYKPSNCRWITRSENSKRVIHKKKDKRDKDDR